MSNLNDMAMDEINIYIDTDKLENSSFKFLFKETIAIKNLLLGEIQISKEKFEELINDTNTPRDIVIRATKFLDTIK
jgi:hypothetical protein